MSEAIRAAFPSGTAINRPVGEIFNKIRISCGSPVDAATLSAVSRLGTIVAELIRRIGD